MGQAKVARYPSRKHSQGRRNIQIYLECRIDMEVGCKLRLKVRLEPWCEGFHARLKNLHFVLQAIRNQGQFLT